MSDEKRGGGSVPWWIIGALVGWMLASDRINERHLRHHRHVGDSVVVDREENGR